MAMTRFEEIKLVSVKTGKCGCGKYRRRCGKFSQTINPWNLNKNGRLKSRNEIRQELEKERAEWKLMPITCQNCQQGVSHD
jgi:hypothetical protein